MLREVIGDAAMLEQTAEECVEMAKAALKYARYLRNENKVHGKTSAELYDDLCEEIADVRICIEELSGESPSDLLVSRDISQWQEHKRERIRMRLGLNGGDTCE